MKSSSSSSFQKIKNKIDHESDFEFDSSQNVSDILHNLNFSDNSINDFSQIISSSPNLSNLTSSSKNILNDEDEKLLDFLNDSCLQSDIHLKSDYKDFDNVSNYLNNLDFSNSQDINFDDSLFRPKLNKKNRFKQNESFSDQNEIKTNKKNESNTDFNISAGKDQKRKKIINNNTINNVITTDGTKLKKSFDDSESREIKNKQEIKSFLRKFNKKYNLHASSLSEVLDMIDMMQLQSFSAKEEEEEKNDYKDKIIRENHERISKLQSEKENLNSEIHEYQEQVNSLKNQVSNLKKSNQVMQNSNKSLQDDIMNLQKSIQALHEIIEQQLGDISNLSEQKTNLLNVIKKQERMVQIIESVQYSSLTKSSNEQPIKQNIPKSASNSNSNIDMNIVNKSIKDEQYSIMCSAVHIANDLLSKNEALCKEIISIQNDSKTPLRERILKIFNLIINSSSSNMEEIGTKSKIIERLKDKNKQYKKKIYDVLSLFEEELVFLQSLTNCNDLQALIFSHKNLKTPLFMNESCKSELIRQCAVLGRFIEETIGTISYESFENNFGSLIETNTNNSIEDLSNLFEPTRIFQLFQTDVFKQKLVNISKRIEDNNNVEVRQIFDILAAQVYINDIIKNYANELQNRLSQCGRDLSNLRLQQQKWQSDYTNNEESSTLKKIVKKFQRRESRLRKFVSNYVEVDEKSNIVTVTITMISRLIEQLQSQSTLSSSYQYSNGSISPSKNIEDERLKLRIEVEKYQKIIKKLEEKISSDETNPGRNQIHDDQSQKIQELQAVIDSTNNELKSLKEKLIEKEKNIETITNEKNELQANYESSLNDAKMKLESAINRIKFLTVEVKKYETILTKTKYQAPKFIKEIQRLNQVNKKLNIKINTLNDKHLTLKDEYENKFNSLNEELNSKKVELETIKAKSQQLSCEIATLSMEKKSNDLKLSAFDKRMELEKQNIITQMNAQSNAKIIEVSQKINKQNNEIFDFIKKLMSFFTTSSNEKEAIFDSFYEKSNNSISFINLSVISNIINEIEKEFEKYKNVQKLYIEMVDRSNEIKSLLKITGNNPDDIVKHVQEMLLNQETQHNSVANVQKKLKQETIENEKLRRTITKYESQCACLKHWENWAKRIYRVIHETDSRQMNSSELRLDLEEALLASVSHKSTLSRLDSLRSQKSILTKFDKNIVQSPRMRNSKIFSIKPIISLAIFVRRSQIESGCLPIISIPLNNRSNQLNSSFSSIYSYKSEDMKKGNKFNNHYANQENANDNIVKLFPKSRLNLNSKRTK